MYTVQWRHIRVRCFQRESSDISGWAENNIPWAKQAKQLANTAGQKLNEMRQVGTAYIDQQSENAKDIARTIDAVQRAMRSTNPRVHGVYQLLRATKVLSLDPKELAQRLMTTDGGSGARAITACIEAAEKGKPIQIVQMSGGKYSVLSIEKYKNLVNNAPWKYLSKNHIEGFAELWISGNRDLSLSWENWQNIAMYLAGNNWKINRWSLDARTQDFLQKLYKIMRDRYAENIATILEPVRKKLWENPEYQKLLQENRLIGKDGKLSIDLLFRGITPEQIKNIPQLIEVKIQRLRTSSNELLRIGNSIMAQNNIDDTSMREFFNRPIIIKVDGKNKNISNINTVDLSPKEVALVIPIFSWEIRKFQDLIPKVNPEEQKAIKAHIKNLQTALQALTLKYEWYKNAGTASELRVIQRQTATAVSPLPEDATREQKERVYTSLRKTIDSTKSQEIRNAARETGIARSHVEQFEWNISLAEAQRRYNAMNPRQQESPEGRRYRAIIEANISLAVEYQKMETNFWQQQAQEIFTAVNRAVSGKAEEVYNFQGLTKIATIKSEWVTQDMKNLAWIKPWIDNKIPLSDGGIWENMGILASKWEQALYAAYIQNGANGYYVILDKNNKPLSQEYLSIDQVEWYRDNILTFTWIWVPELIPYISFINREIGKRDFYRVDSLDGDFSYKESFRVLRGLAQISIPDEEIPKTPNEIIKLLQRKARESGRPTLWEFMRHQMEISWIIGDDWSFNKVRFSSLLNTKKR